MTPDEHLVAKVEALLASSKQHALIRDDVSRYASLQNLRAEVRELQQSLYDPDQAVLTDSHYVSTTWVG